MLFTSHAHDSPSQKMKHFGWWNKFFCLRSHFFMHQIIYIFPKLNRISYVVHVKDVSLCFCCWFSSHKYTSQPRVNCEKIFSNLNKLHLIIRMSYFSSSALQYAPICCSELIFVWSTHTKKMKNNIWIDHYDMRMASESHHFKCDRDC